MTNKQCKYCDSIFHFSFQCKLRPRKEKVKKPFKSIRKVSKKTVQKKKDFDAEWYRINPPNEFGRWQCYLHIVSNCEITVDRSTINLEHKLSKARRPDLRYVISNVGAACSPCNSYKGSRNWDEKRHILC